MKSKAIIIFLSAVFIVLSCQRHSSSPVKFISEEIKMSVNPDQVIINASYCFENISDSTKLGLIFYPFPVDDYHYYPDSILVNGLDYTKNDSGVNFKMRYKPSNIETLKVFYRQILKANQARYILTTTKRWNSPLKEARFIIDVPLEINNPNFSYKPDSLIRTTNRVFYYLSKKNFMPKKDLIIIWQ